MSVTYEQFQELDLRVGKIVEVRDFPRAKKPAYRVVVDFGLEIGTKQSSVQAVNYKKEELQGLQVVAVLGFPSKNIAGFLSEVLILGVAGEDGELSLLTPSKEALIGTSVY
ncbi:tRNA-binding protein [Priestia taiwanensis]|uniref:tRNA-binding protein n=1 Tax=Priestia taiwanensis TaxID=1347902 RepID=A0A917APG3_9BACI|nr:tRNA-binding protein [Priestia taiwanensis]MBM7362617.1 tRNA-binding protein [Priestia taiwanensis]GGE63704.1 tRNA-binding protein [Priestia taiwanensis]